MTSNAANWSASGLDISVDNGVTWSEMDSTLPNPDVRALAVSPGPGLGLGSLLFVGTTGGIFRSANVGGSWTDCNASLPNCDVRSLIVTPGDMSDIHVLAGTWGGGVFLSSDTGATWTSFNSGLTNWNIRSLTISGDTIFAGTEEGVFRYEGSGWIAASSGLTGTFVRALAAHGTNLIAGTQGNGVFLSSDGGTTWVPRNTGLPNRNIRSLAFADTVLLAGTDGNGVFRSTNKGNTWPWNNTDRGGFYSLAVSGGKLFAGTEGGLMVSTNKGIIWTGVGPWVSLYALAIDSAEGGTGAGDVFAGTWTDGIFRSTDHGLNWMPASSGLPATVVLSLAVVPADVATRSTKLLVGTWGSGIFLSTDRGATWLPANAGLTHPWVYALAVSDSHVFAGTRGGGVFLSTDGGASWAAINEGLGDLDVVSLAFMGADLIAGTEGGGVWKRALPGMRVADAQEAEVPACFRLEQNYPNPFNPSTTITYALPRPSVVRLSVFDLLGREVMVLVNERRHAGVHSVRFDATGLPSGVYWYRLQAEEFVQARKLLLLK